MFSIFSKKNPTYYKNLGIKVGVKCNLEQLKNAQQLLNSCEGKMFTKEDIDKINPIISKVGLDTNFFYWKETTSPIEWMGSNIGNLVLELLPAKDPYYENKNDERFFSWLLEKGIFPGVSTLGNYGFGWKEMMLEAEKIEFIYTQRLKFADFDLSAFKDSKSNQVFICSELKTINITEYNKTIQSFKR
jgi:hypothetical protein